MAEFTHPAMQQLTDQQVRFAPPARRREQVIRAEKLLGEVETDRLYPYTFICFRVTDYRPEVQPDPLISGGELKRDLVLFIKQLERSIPALPIEQAIEPMLTLEQISKQFNVSAKTISRWRVRGLVGQRVVVNGRRQLGYAQSVVSQFLAQHQERVHRSARFSHLSDEEKETILRRAQRLARAGATLTQVSRRIARKLNRSVEAVRYTIKNFDQRNPDQAIFPTLSGPLDGDTKRLIFQAHKEGVPMQSLAKRYNKSRTTVYRAERQARAEKVVRPAMDYVPNETFDDPALEAEFLSVMPGEEEFQEAQRKMRAPRDVPPELASLYEWPLLSKEQEQHQFRQMNYLKHKLNKLRDNVDLGDPLTYALAELEALQRQILTVKERLINCNMRLVAKIAKTHANQSDSLFELMSDGNISLMRAVEKFDFSRGNKFSTYATWAIVKNFARSIPDEKHVRERYVTGHEELFDGRADIRTDEQEVMAMANQARAKINRLLETLDPRTREVIRMRNGLDGSEEMTLEQIGQHFGITKERVRQINVRGMKQLREKAMAEKVELP